MKRKTIKKSKSKFADKPSFKWVICRQCHTEEVKVSEDTIEATCSTCVQKMSPPPAEAPKSTGRPRGWQFMKLFVDKDGLVYHKGVEKPKLKGTLPPTETKKNSNKKSAFERNQERLAKETKLANKYKKKQDKKNGKNSNGRRRAKKTK